MVCAKREVGWSTKDMTRWIGSFLFMVRAASLTHTNTVHSVAAPGNPAKAVGKFLMEWMIAI